MARANIDEDEVPRVRPGSHVEPLALGVAQGTRVVVGDHDPPRDAALQRVNAIPRDRPPSEILLEGILDVSRGWRGAEPGLGRLQEGQPPDEKAPSGIEIGQLQGYPTELLVLRRMDGPVQDEPRERPSWVCTSIPSAMRRITISMGAPW